jgi:hypothetical protein
VLSSERDVVVRRSVVDRMTGGWPAADDFHIVGNATNHAARRGLAIVTSSGDTAAGRIHDLALVVRLDGEQDQRLVVPILGVIAVSIADGAGVGLVEDETLFLALEVEDELVVGADLFPLDAAMVTRMSRPPRSDAFRYWEGNSSEIFMSFDPDCE